MASVTRNPRPLFVTTLPAGYDGQEVFYQSTTAGTGGGATNSMADVGAVYHLRYRAAASGSHKWEAVGVSNIYHNVEAEQSTSSTSYAALTTAGPLMTAPLAGEYLIGFGAHSVGSLASYGNIMSVELGTTATDADSIQGNVRHPMMRVIKPTLTSGTTALVTKYKAEAANTSSFGKRWLQITPIRVG